MLRHRRLALFVSFVCFVGTSFLSAADASFVRLWPGWREADSFDRIGEFLGGPEKHLSRTVVRTQTTARAGYYFLLRVHSEARLDLGTKFELAVIRPDAPAPKVFTFAVAAPPGDTVFDLGVTGADWPGGKQANPVAWKLTLVAPDGRILTEHKSFLWEKPAK
jgi:hypothetical protein